MGASERKQFEVIKEGFAKARFGGALAGCDMTSVGGAVTFAPVENNGGLNPEEFFVKMARLLSMAVTPYRKFDFTREGVLKKATGLFEGVTLYTNHDIDVNGWSGLVQNCVWDDKSTPPGINAMLVVDKTVDPKLARGLEIKALRSVSVTIWFNYERSHPDLANFYDRLGEMVDGEMVRFIVTEITNAGEVSVVWEGEDPYAKTFAAEPGASSLENNDTGGNEDMLKLTAVLLSTLGITAGTEVTAELLEGKINEKITALQTQIDTLEPDALLGTQLLTETRERAVTLYKSAKGEKFQQPFVDGVILKSDLATARALVTEYETEVEKTIPLACPKCGEKLSRRSSAPEKPGSELTTGKRPEDYKV